MTTCSSSSFTVRPKYLSSIMPSSQNAKALYGFSVILFSRSCSNCLPQHIGELQHFNLSGGESSVKLQLRLSRSWNLPIVVVVETVKDHFELLHLCLDRYKHVQTLHELYIIPIYRYVYQKDFKTEIRTALPRCIQYWTPLGFSASTWSWPHKGTRRSSVSSVANTKRRS